MIRSIITKKSRILILLLSISILANAQISVNTTGSTANTSAMLDVSSTEKGMLIPRMGFVQRTAISTPANGLLVFDTTSESFWYYNGTAAEWQKVGNAVAGATRINELSDGRTDFNGNLFLGWASGSDNAVGVDNTAFGRNTLHDNTSGFYNVAVGNSAMEHNTSGYRNTAVGRFALYDNTQGTENSVFGTSTSLYNTTGNNNVAIGVSSNLFNQNGNNNTIIGTKAGYGTLENSISGNIFLGYQAGYNETGDNKLYIENSNSATPLIGGDFASNYVDINGDLNLRGSIKIEGGTPGANKILTSDTDGNATWETNTVATEINELTDAAYDGTSLFIGSGSGLNDDGANGNTGIGRSVLSANTSGNGNTAVGISAMNKNTNGVYNVAFGNNALNNNITGNNNTALGGYSLLANTTGIQNTSIGHSSSASNTTGGNNTIVGVGANYFNQEGGNNTIIGQRAGAGAALHSKSGNIFLGYQSGYNETGSNKLYIENSNSATPLIGGDFANDSLFFNGVVRITGGNPGANKVLTSDADGNATWEANNAATEINGLSDAVYDGSSLFLGENAGENDNGAAQNVGVGKYALQNNTIGIMNTSAGVYALQSNTSGQNNTATGNSSLKNNSTGNFNTAMGSTVLQNNTADNNTALGYAAMITNTTGYKNVAVGVNALKLNVNGFYNVAVGYEALKSVQSGTYNSAFGANSLFNTKGDRNTGSGFYSLYSNTTGSYNTAFGYRSGYENTTGTYNTFLGYNARANNTTAKTNSTAVGNDAVITASNQVRIGNASVTDIGGYADWTNISDKRFKYNISEDVSGLDFIMKLRPVNYNLDIQKINNFLGVEIENLDAESIAMKSNTRQSGFIAQEVEEAAKKMGFDFSGIDLPENENDHYGLRYAQFVVPLVKAIQEQQDMIEQLRQENNELKKIQLEIEELKKSIKMLQ